MKRIFFVVTLNPEPGAIRAYSRESPARRDLLYRQRVQPGQHVLEALPVRLEHLTGLFRLTGLSPKLAEACWRQAQEAD